MARKKSQDVISLVENDRLFIQYFEELQNLAMSMFEWKNVPDTVDIRYLETALFERGMAVYFRDEALGDLALNCMIGGRLNVYNIPTERRAYANNGYQNSLDENNSVIIWNDMLHRNSIEKIRMFAYRLYEVQRVIDVNINAQKTPVLIECDENNRLTMENVYNQYTGNKPVIFGNKGLSNNAFKVWKTDAPYLADKLYIIKNNIWNEALTYLGISNINVNKKERLISDEISKNLGGTVANRYSRLNERQQAVEKINKMFGTNISVEFRDDFNLELLNLEDEKESEVEVDE